MEFDWINVPFTLVPLSPREVEESFEDPFAIRLLPDEEIVPGQARYFNLGMSLNQTPVFCVFWTDGKRYRVISARHMTDEEDLFYKRKNAELL